MKYLCLRDCYVEDVLWRKGEVYELPDNMVKSEKNFQPLGEQPIEEPEPKAPEPKPKPVKPDVIPKGQFWCTKCKTLHREIGTSKIGQKHLKYKEVKGD